METTVRLDTSNLNRAIAVFVDYRNKNPAQSVNKTAIMVIRKAQENTPFVSSSEIDADMNVTTSPEVTASGRLSKDKTKQHGTINFQNRTPTASDVSAINTAERIVLARMHPTSRFNVLTGGRWAITPPDFGRGRSKSTDSISLFWKWVRDVATRMVKARHSSPHFLQHSWAPIIEKLRPYVPPSYRGNPLKNPLGTDVSIGEVEPAKEGAGLAVCKIANRIGMDSPNKVLGEKHNQAAIGILVPILQKAIDSEFDGKMKYASKQGWVDRRQNIESCGFLVRIN